MPQEIEKTVQGSEVSGRATGGFGPSQGPQSIVESSSSRTGSVKAASGTNVKPALKAQRPHASQVAISSQQKNSKAFSKTSRLAMPTAK